MTLDSIYYFKNANEFKHLIHSIADQSQLISEALAVYREIQKLPDKFKNMTVQELSDNPRLIQELDQSLRNATNYRGITKFPLKWKMEDRQSDLLDKINQIYSIVKPQAKAKIVTSSYIGPEGYQQFPYCLEAIMVPRKDQGRESAGEIYLLGNINSTPSIDGGSRYFDTASEVIYRWNDRRGDMKTATTLTQLLAKCGFDTYASMSKRRVPCVLYINLMTPCPEWLGAAGKTNINLAPYANDIAKVIPSLAYKMPSYYGTTGPSRSSDYTRLNEDTQTNYLTNFLKKRYLAIYGDPAKKIKGNLGLKFSDRITQSGVWYRVSPIMIKDGFKPRKDWGKTRKSMVGDIRRICAELSALPVKYGGWGHKVTREDLGIIAKARAMMLYNGQVYPVSIDNVLALAKKGVAIVVIEKEGLAEVLKYEAQKYGVALVHTGGRFTDYTLDLIEEAKTVTPYVVTLTDYDVYGMQTSAATETETVRIGIDMETIEWLKLNGYPNLRKEDVDQEYTPKIETDDEYLQHHRIELDSIQQLIGAEVFWKFVMYRLEELAKKEDTEKGFNYIDSEVIKRPESDKIYPEVIVKLLEKLENYAQDITKDTWDEIAEPLKDTKELVSIEQQDIDNITALTDVVTQDKIMQETVIPKVQKLLDELDEVIPDADADAIP